jgi:hypothetical protein
MAKIKYLYDEPEFEKRYLIFAFFDCEANGGLADVRAEAGTLEELIAELKEVEQKYARYAQINLYDQDTRRFFMLVDGDEPLSN